MSRRSYGEAQGQLDGNQRISLNSQIILVKVNNEEGPVTDIETPPGHMYEANIATALLLWRPSVFAQCPRVDVRTD